MKKLFAALAVCVSAVAFANNDVKTQDSQQSASQQQEDTTKPMWNATDLRSQAPGASAQQAEAERNDATGGSGQDNRSLGEKTKDALGLSKEDQAKKKAEEDSLYKSSAQAFNLSGTVKSASDKELKIDRTGLPEAKLKVHDQTVAMLNGKRVKASEIPEGSTVRARFNLDGSDMVAVRIDATSNKNATGGAGAAGTESKTEAKAKSSAKSAKTNAKDAAHDTKNAAKDTAHDTSNAAKDAAHDTKNTAKDAAHDTNNAAKDAAHDTGNAVHDATH